MGAINGIIRTLGELFHFLWKRKLWWLIPMIIILILFVGIFLFANATGLGPFIYTLF